MSERGEQDNKGPKENSQNKLRPPMSEGEEQDNQRA